MKPSIIVSIAIVLASCSAPMRQRAMPEQQVRYARFVAEEAENYQSITSEKYKADYCRGFEQRAYRYMDSLTLLRRWVGTLERCERQRRSYAEQADVEIRCGEMTFHSRYMVEKDSAAEDAVWCALGALEEGSEVRFDGVVMTHNNGTLHYHRGTVGDERNITSPHYGIYIIDIGEAEDEETPIYNDLQRAQRAAYNIVEPEALYYNGKLSEAGREAKSAAASEVMEECYELLSETEKSYIRRLVRALTFRYRYGD